VIEVCICLQGDGGIFAKTVNWHREQAQLTQVGIEAAATRAFGLQMLWAALISFGVFLSLALLLIFSKIESNLRVIREESSPTDSAALDH